jgi:ribosomal protein S28E/S33
LVKTGRKTTNVSRVKCAIATGLTIGDTLTVAVAGPILGAEQIEQKW